MTIFRAPLTDHKGDIRVAQVASGAVPAGAVQYRGLWVTLNGLVCGTPDTGQPRIFQGGIAFEASSGLLLIGDGSATPLKMPMDGMLVDANGAFLGAPGAGQVIHQGVNFINQSTGGNPRVNVDDPIASFYASLQYGYQNTQGEGTFARNSSGTYVDFDGVLREVGANESRHEAAGLLMEPASTNKCENWNANPDDGLVNVDPPAFRILDTEKIREAGLGRVCTSGYAICIDNIGGGSSVVCLVGGSTGNTNNHVYGGYGRVDQGEGRINQSGGGTPFASFTSQSYERKHVIRDPGAGARQLVLQAQPNSKCYFLLNQLEEQPVITSPIITKGVAASRAADVLNWDSSFFNQSEGMAALEWVPTYDDPLTGGQLRILRHGSTDSNFLYMDGNPLVFSSHDGTSVAAAPAIPGNMTENARYLIGIRWATAQRQVGFKVGGTWYWGTQVGYDGSFDGTGIFELMPYVGSINRPSYSRNLYVWTQDKGTAWLESYFSGVAN